MAEVEIDPDTGVIEIAALIARDDFGKTVNPLIVRGQVAGWSRATRQAVLENTVFDRESGRALVRQLHGLCPAARRRPAGYRGRPAGILRASNPLGEARERPGRSAAALINAIIDALSPCATHVDMPATPEKVWRAIGLAKAA